jgi:hypothetical protein
MKGKRPAASKALDHQTSRDEIVGETIARNRQKPRARATGRAMEASRKRHFWRGEASFEALMSSSERCPAFCTIEIAGGFDG